MKRRFILTIIIAALTVLVHLAALAVEYHHSEEDVTKKLAEKQFSPYVDRTYPSRVFWGDQHLHTEISVDAGTMCRLGQEDAYRFARGEEVVSTTGVRAKLSRPLDWLVIADHAEMYGLMPQLLKGDPNVLANKEGKSWYDALKSGDKQKMFATAMVIVAALNKPDPPGDFRQSSAMNTPPAVGSTFTATCFSAAMRRWPIKCCRFRSSTARIRKISGKRWTHSKSEPGRTCWPSRTTAICPTA